MGTGRASRPVYPPEPVVQGPTSSLRPLACLLLPLLAACGGSGGGGSSNPSGPDVSPPTVTVSAPTGPLAVLPGDSLHVVFTANDDRNAAVRVVLDADADPNTTGDQVVLFTGIDQNGAQTTLDLSTAGVPTGRYELYVIADDQTNPPAVAGASLVVVYPGLAGVSPPRANRYGVTGTHIVFSVGEAEQGNTILNGDGDVGDGVMTDLDAKQGTMVQTGLSVDVTAPILQPVPVILPNETDGIAWPMREQDQGQILNGDGDTADTVVAFTAPLLGIGPKTSPIGGATLTAAGPIGRRVVIYNEIQHGFDLNGDGDVMDLVVAGLDYATNTLSSVFPPQLRPGAAFVGTTGSGAYLVDEGTQGPNNLGIDLNLDGDTLDTLVTLVDLNTVAVVVVGKSNADPARPITGATNALFPLAGYTVVESLASPGVPLNGDADSTDLVPTLNNGIEHFPVPPSPPLNATGAARFAFGNGPLVVQTASEEGVNDWNADLDTLDTEIVYWADASPPVPVWRTVAPGGTPLAGIALDGGSAAQVWPGWVGMAVSEAANSYDFNADGDQGDTVFMLLDLTSNPPVLHNTGLVPLNPSLLPLQGATLALTGVGGDTGVVVQAAESANGDLNLDGDTTDTLLVYFDYAAPTTRVFLPNTGGLHAGVRGGVIAVTAYEALTGVDFDGDGDALDFVLRCFDTTGAVLEPGRVCTQYSVPASDDGHFWAFVRSETEESADLNQDGDIADLVLGVWLH